MLMMGLCVVGGITVAKHTLNTAWRLWKTFLRPSKDLFARYQGGYVVITGATHGLGLEYTHQFARKGFSLVLIARNREKLQGVKNTLLALYPNIDIKTIVFDFDIPYTEEDYLPLKQSLAQLTDVSILVNNVGAIATGYFNDMPLSDMNRIIQTNCIPQVVMTKYLLPEMLKRSQIEGKRCAIINLSSVARYTNLIKTAVYAATKSYNKTLSDVLRKEVGEFIDVMAVLPGPTRSNMIRFEGPFVIQPEQHVRWALSDLGYNKQTFGHYKHWMYCNAYRLPYFETWYTQMRERKLREIDTKIVK